MSQPDYVEDFIWEVAEAGLDPVEAATAWARGLRAAGATRVKKAYIGGISLPRVVEFDCPFWHEPEIVGTVAKVRLLVRRDGWAEFYQGMDGKAGSESCRACRAHKQMPPEGRFAAWLITCPLCDRAEHPEHVIGGPMDGSPYAHVVHAVTSRDVNQEADESDAIATVDAAVTWLDGQTDDDGVLLVPESAGQQAAWEAVKNLPGCPTQTLVRRAQAERKARG